MDRWIEQIASKSCVGKGKPKSDKKRSKRVRKRSMEREKPDSRFKQSTKSGMMMPLTRPNDSAGVRADRCLLRSKHARRRNPRFRPASCYLRKARAWVVFFFRDFVPPSSGCLVSIRHRSTYFHFLLLLSFLLFRCYQRSITRIQSLAVRKLSPLQLWLRGWCGRWASADWYLPLKAALSTFPSNNDRAEILLFPSVETLQRLTSRTKGTMTRC